MATHKATASATSWNVRKVIITTVFLIFSGLFLIEVYLVIQPIIAGLCVIDEIMQPEPSHNLIFLDTETTGIVNGRLIQLAYKKQGDANICVEYYKPPTPIEIEAMVVHHITEKHVANRPPFLKSPAYEKLQALLPDSSWLPIMQNST